MTRIKDPKQVANSIRHILLILIRSPRGCFMAGLGGCCSLGWDALRCWTLRVSGGTEEDCRPVNEPNSSTAERTTARTSGGGKGLRDTPPYLEKMNAPRCTLVSRSITEEENKSIGKGLLG